MSITVTRNPNLSKNLNAKEYISEVQNSFNEKNINWWTGLAPENCPGFDKERGALSALPLLNLDLCTRQDVLDYFNNSWTLTEQLFQSIKTHDAFIRSPYHGLRHPMMFYYGHPAVLYVNKLRIAGLLNTPLNTYLEKVLETGVDEMSWDDMSKNEMLWPSVFEVHEYRQQVYDLVSNLIKTHPDLDLDPKKRNFKSESPWWSLWMGFEHEKIHFETSSVLLREMPLEFLETPKYWAPIHPSKDDQSEITNSWVKSTGGRVTLGKEAKTPSYGWDNEYGKREVEIKDFQFSKFQITNREFFEFVKSGAYIDDKYWAQEGLHWRKFRNTKRPTFWVGVGAEGTHEYELRVLFNVIPMPWNWPCEVNYHEALAYCKYKEEKDNSKLTYRLFTEAEMKKLKGNERDHVLQQDHMSHYKDLSTLEELYKENFNFKYSSPKNVDENLYGNSWHWLMDQFNPLEGFKVTPLYDDFSTPCFDGKHQMLMGGSFISCGDEASFWSRFHFRPHFYQHSSFRIAATLDGSSDNGATYLNKEQNYIHPKRVNVLDQMNEKDWWMNVSQPLELSQSETQEILELTSQKVLTYLAEFNTKNPMGKAHDPSVNGLKKDFSLPFQSTINFPEAPSDYKSLLNIIFDDLQDYSQLPGHPGFGAYMAGSGNFISNTAQLIAQTLNPFTGHYMMAPGPVAIELEVINWFKDLMGFSLNESGGFLTTGTSLATLSAIAMARNRLLKNQYDYSLVSAYTSKDAHHSIAKAWVMLGFKKENLRAIDLIDHKMSVDHLKKTIEEDIKKGMKPLLIVPTLGSTKTGAVDDLEKILSMNQKFKLWIHADGAYGAPFMLTNKGKEILKGIEAVDSLALDPHKAMSLPYGTGILLVKNKNEMIFDYLADNTYMPPAPQNNHEVDFADISPELSRDFRGLRVWLPIKTLGIAPFRLNLEEKLELKNWFKNELAQIKKLEIESDSPLTILSFRHSEGDQKTRELLAKINNKGTLFLSSAMIDGKFCIRICLLGFRMHYQILSKGLLEIKGMV